MADYDYNYGRDWYSPGNLPQRKASKKRSSSTQRTTSSSGGGTGGGVRGNNPTRKSQTSPTQVSSSRGSYGRVALTTPAATMRLSLPQDIITESIINTPIKINQRTQESTTSPSPRTSSAQRTSTKPRTSSRPRTSIQRTTQQNIVTPIQPTQTWRFTEGKLIAPKPAVNAGVESLEELTSQPVLDNKPGSEPVVYDTNYIRGFRGQGQRGYRDVDSYLTWLENNKDSDDYKLFMQNGYFDNKGNLDQGQIREMLTSQGIRGNLGRRDSGRLGNVLTRLRNQSTVGTAEHDQFMQGAVDQFNATKQLYTPKDGKYAGRTFRDLQYNPNATKKGEEISFKGNDTDDMEGWFEPTRQHLVLPYFIGRNPYSIYNPFFDIFGNLKGGYNPTTGLENINKWWIPFINKSINTPGTGGYDVTTPPYFGFNRTLY